MESLLETIQAAYCDQLKGNITIEHRDIIIKSAINAYISNIIKNETKVL